MLKLDKISKSYSIDKNDKISLLNDISLDINNSKFYGIIGHSGSGKSTLLNIIGLIDDFDSGKYFIDNKEVNYLSEDEKSSIRMKKFGFVFQSFYLNNRLTALENVMIPMYINKGIPKSERKKIAMNLLEKFGLGNRINHRPNQLSGGEQQRVAIARALANNPEVILADEPTGNLDKKNEEMIFNYFKKLVTEDKKTVVIVSHNEIINKYADIIYKLEDGKIYKEVIDNEVK
mgnify:CR=1 FL=1